MGKNINWLSVIAFLLKTPVLVMRVGVVGAGAGGGTSTCCRSGGRLERSALTVLLALGSLY